MLQHQTSEATTSFPVLIADNETAQATSSALPEADLVRLEDYLDQVLAPLTRVLPFARRQELRRELRQHLEAIIDANREMGETPTAACNKALAQFGKPEQIAASIKKSLPAGRWQRMRAWWTQPRLSVVGAVVPLLTLVGVAYFGLGARLAPPQQTVQRAEPVMIAQAGVRFHHSAVLQHPCNDCHRGTPLSIPRVYLIQNNKEAPRWLVQLQEAPRAVPQSKP